MAEEETTKTVIVAPELPSVVQGDGRYLMSLLKSYLDTANTQINLANGFTADDIEAAGNSSKVAMPKHFTLTFNRAGGLFTWDYPVDITSIAYYELRIDTNVGNSFGLLERTTNNYSYVMSIKYSDKVYLYAANSNNEYSNPATITYTKARPDAPSDIALTKNNEGTLITFLDIPSDCIGANIYVNGIKYSTVDNVFLFAPSDPDYQIITVAVVYYDSFGEGEKAVINCVISNVTGFFVEKNGANLDFYWDPIDIYGVKYVVKVGQTNDWDTGVELFTTKLNKQRYIYPNDGSFYFMIKACDDHNNYSVNATWYLLIATKEIEKNVILDFKQSSILYSGNKINMYYNAEDDGLRLDTGKYTGEYIVDIGLPQTYRARSWAEYKIMGKADSDIYIDDLQFLLDSDECKLIYLNGKATDLVQVTVTQQLARYIGASNDGGSFLASLNGTITPDSGGTVLESLNTSDFRTGRWANGLYIGPYVKLAYTLNTIISSNFNITFWLKTTTDLNDTIICMLRKTSATYFLCLGYDLTKSCYYLTDGLQRIEVAFNMQDKDYLFFGIVQEANSRKLFIYSFNQNRTFWNYADYAPQGSFDLMYLYPKIN